MKTKINNIKPETISGTTIDHIKPFSFTSIPKNGPNNIPTNNVAIVTAPVLKGLWVVLKIYVIKPSVVAVLPIVEKIEHYLREMSFYFLDSYYHLLDYRSTDIICIVLQSLN